MKNNVGKIVIAILILIIIGLSSYIVYDKFIKSSEDNQDKVTEEKTKSLKVDETKDYIYYEKEDLNISLKSIGEMPTSEEYTKSSKIFNDKLHVELNKMILNIDSEDAKTINKKIDDIYDEAYKFYTVKNSKEMDNNCSATFSNDVTVSGELYPSYEIEEADEYLSIIIHDNQSVFCGQRFDRIAVYTISKKTGKLYTKDEILNGVSEETILREAIKDYDEYISLKDNDNDGKSFEDYYYYLTKDGQIGVKYINAAVSGYESGTYKRTR